MPGPRVFVSHSHIDNDFAAQLVADLKAAGADVWLDVVGIDRGDFQERINEALGGCQYFVLVLMPEALRSPWVRMETHAAIKRTLEGVLHQVLPVVAQPVDPNQIPPTWATFQRYDATRDYPSALAAIVHALGLQMPVQMPVAPQSPRSMPTPRQALRESRPRWIRPVTASLTALLVLVVVVVAVVKSSPNLFGAGVSATATLQVTITDPTPTAAQWQPVIQAMRAYCVAVMATNYAQAYQMLSRDAQVNESFTSFMYTKASVDTNYGVVTSCAPQHNPVVDRFAGEKLAIYSVAVTRQNSHVQTGPMPFVLEDGRWKIARDGDAFGVTAT